MKASYIKIAAEKQSQFYCSYLDLPQFDHPWHFHPEMELTLILESSGIRYVGDNTARFKAGDLILLGPNVPHLWQNSKTDEDSTSRSRALVLQIQPDFLSSVFKSMHGLEPLIELFKNAERGVSFSSNTSKSMTPLFREIYEKTGLKKWAAVFRLLAELSEIKDYKLLASTGYVPQITNQDFDLMNQIFKYVKDNIDSKITLQEMADLAYLTKHSFCRFFKQKTGKSFFTFLNEYRINHAKRLLLESEHLSVNEVALKSGFPSVQHFNSKFKELNEGLTPTKFLKNHREVQTN